MPAIFPAQVIFSTSKVRLQLLLSFRMAVRFYNSSFVFTCFCHHKSIDHNGLFTTQALFFLLRTSHTTGPAYLTGCSRFQNLFNLQPCICALQLYTTKPYTSIRQHYSWNENPTFCLAHTPMAGQLLIQFHTAADKRAKTHLAKVVMAHKKRNP